MRWLIAPIVLCAILLGAGAGVSPARLHVTFPGRTVSNSYFMAASFLYQLQTILSTTAEVNAAGTNVLDSRIVGRQGFELFVDLDRLGPGPAGTLRQLAVAGGNQADLSLTALDAWMDKNYYRLTKPYPTLQALLAEHSYRANPEWMVVPVDSATFHRRRVIYIQKDRIADALASYFNNSDLLLYEKGTVIVAESLDKRGRFVDAEVLSKRGDSFWNFVVYDSSGYIVPSSAAFNEEGEPDPKGHRLQTSRDCAVCHRIDRIDFSGEPQAPIRSPVRSFFQRLPARTPEIHLGPEYYDHLAFVQLTEATGKRKDGVFGVYGSLLLSELAGRKKLGTLTAMDLVRYRRLQPLFPELLTPLERTDSLTNAIGMRLLRIPQPQPFELMGSLSSDPDRRTDETRHKPVIHQPFFLSMYKITNREFRRFRPDHHVPPYRGIDLDGDELPAAEVSYADALAFVAWLNAMPPERNAGRTYRLPTEDEWEFSARGADDRRFPWGDQWPPPDGAGNLASTRGYHDAFAAASPVGKFWPNPYFLYDMAGDGYEWTSSAYTSSRGGLMVTRGSSWTDESAKTLRCASRHPEAPDTRVPDLGFRVAADIPALR